MTWRVAGLLLCLLALLAAACGSGGAEGLPESPTIGILRAVPPTDIALANQSLQEELRNAGFVEGHNLRIRPASATTIYPDPEAAERAVSRWRADGLDLVVAMSSGGAAAAHRAAPDVPVLFISNDPTVTGLVGNERRPEGQLTGVTYRVPADRTLDLARRILPDLALVGLVHPRGDAAALAHLGTVTTAVDAFELRLVVEEFDPGEAANAVERLVDQGIDALLLSSSPGAVLAVEETQAAARRGGVPVIANTDRAGSALLALYPDSREVERQLGRQAARILSGSSPSSIPVEDPRRFLTRVDAGVAADLGIALSEDVLREVNRVVTR